MLCQNNLSLWYCEETVKNIGGQLMKDGVIEKLTLGEDIDIFYILYNFDIFTLYTIVFELITIYLFCFS